MLEIFEILDRFELLYPKNQNVSDLRRAYIDRDLSSIFRLLRIHKETDILDDLRKAVIESNLHSIFRLMESRPDILDDLRKAVIESNLHSLFRLVDHDDLRKLILEDNIWKLWSELSSHVDTQLVPALKNLQMNNVEIDPDCFSRGQLMSKLWVIDELRKLDVDLGTVFLCAGWYGILATLIFESDMTVGKIISFDIDETCIDISEVFNKKWFVDGWRFKSVNQNIMDIDYASHTWQAWSKTNNRFSRPITDSPDTIINTSCEHIGDFSTWYNKIPDGKLVILQGNDYYAIAEHVNCSDDVEDFSRKAHMAQTLYQGELVLPKYTRFMKIGYK